MRSIQKVFAVSLTVLMMIPPSAMAQLAPAPTQVILSQGQQNSHLKNWIYRYEGQMMRARLDLAVSNLLETDPDAIKAVQEVMAQMENSVATQELQLDLSAARSSLTIDPDNSVRQIVQKVARAEGFPEDAIHNAKLWTTMGQVNAYTFSPLEDRLNVVIYQDLLDMLGTNEAALEGVLAHELGHVKMKHVLTGMVVQAVFDASGRILIPDEAKKMAFQSALRTSGAELLKKAIDFDGPVADAIVKVIQKHAAIAGQNLAQKLGHQGLAALANKMNKAVGGSDLFAINEGQVTSLVMADTGDTKGDPKSFKAANTRLTRDQERTADRWGVLTAGPEAVAEAMAKLAGGRNGSAANLLKQAREALVNAAALHMDLKTLDTQDHPGTIIRVAAAVQFAESDNYKIMKDPLLKAFDQYMKIQKELKANADMLKANQIEQINADNLIFDSASLQKYAQQLERAITAEIVDEASGQRSVEKMEKLIKLIDVSVADILQRDAVTKMPLFKTLKSALVAMPDNETAKALLAEVKTRIPDPLADTSLSNLQKSLRQAGAAAGTTTTTVPVTVMSCSNVILN